MTLAVTLAACASVPGPATAGSAAPAAAPSAAAAPGKVTVEAPTSATLEVGQVQPLLAAAVYGDGKRDQELLFTVADAGVAQVDPVTGRVTGVGPGATTVKVTATADPTRFATVVVVVKPVATDLVPEAVTVDPAQSTVARGATTQLRATVRYRGGRVDARLSWSSGEPAIATVDATGLVTGVAKGAATIRATSDVDGSTAGEARITVE